jgi:hypothetical protein
MLSMFLHERGRFMAHYNKRNNVETVFSMIKANFGDYVRGRNERAQVNEALAKVLCHNLCVLIQAVYELGIEPKFDAVVDPDAESKKGPGTPEPAAGGRIVVASRKEMSGREDGKGKRSGGRRDGVDPAQLPLFGEADVRHPTSEAQGSLF